jgi:hypothetical protein
MSGAETGDSPTGKYITEPLRETGTPFEPEPLYHEPPRPAPAPTSRVMGPHVADLCERCRALIDPAMWASPPAASERVQHFNEIQTAYINTACNALADLTGDETYRTNRAFALTTLAQLFIMSEPMDGIRNAWQVRPSRVERGKIADADWVEVVETGPAAAPVEPVAPPAPEPAPERGADLMYDEPGDGADLYRDRSGDVYPKGDDE